MPVGKLNCALSGAPPSPAKPGVPLPATVVMFALGVHLADAAVAVLHDVDVAGGVHRDGDGGDQAGAGGGSAVAWKPIVALPAKVAILPSVPILRMAGVGGVGDIDVARAIDRDIGGAVTQLTAGGTAAAVAGVAGIAVAGDRC